MSGDLSTTTGKSDPGPSGLPAGLSQPAIRALTLAGYTQLEQITGTTAAELLKLHGVGPKTIRILNEAFAAHGLTFAGNDAVE